MGLSVGPPLKRPVNLMINEALVALAEAGHLTPHIYRHYGFDDLVQVLDSIAAREVIGRVVMHWQE